jgi:hypothetical protein
VTDYSTILEVYSLEDILELNDITEEEALDFLVTQDFLKLPRIKPLAFND